MTVSTTAPRVSYTANGTATAFAVPFTFIDSDHLAVYVDGVSQTSGYSVTGEGDAGGGTLTFDAAPAAAATVLIFRDTPQERTTDFATSGEFNASVVNEQFDGLVMMAQDLEDRLSRTLRLGDAVAAGTATLTLPAPADRANGVLTFDASGNAEITPEDAFNTQTVVLDAIEADIDALQVDVTQLQADVTDLAAADHTHDATDITETTDRNWLTDAEQTKLGTLTANAKPLEIQAAGVQKVTAASMLNFTGSVSVTESGTTAVVNVTGSEGTTYIIPADIGGGRAGDAPLGEEASAPMAVEDEGVSVASGVTTMNFSGSGVTVTDDGGGSVTVSMSGVGATNAFGAIAVSGQSTVEADTAPDTVTFVGQNNVAITTNAGTDTITWDGTHNHDADYVDIAHDGAGGAAHADAIAGGADGFLTGADKTKLDAITVAAATMERTIGFAFVGKPSASSPRLSLAPIGRVLRLASGLSSGADLEGGAVAAATANSDFTVDYSTDNGANWSNFGTIRIAAAGRAPAVQAGFAALLDLGADDLIRCVAPSSQDATLADIVIAIKGTIQS